MPEQPPDPGSPADPAGAPDDPRSPDDLAGRVAFADFPSAAGAVLDQLRAEVGFRHWAVTRISGGTYAVLATGSAGYPAGVGSLLPYTETLCHDVHRGAAPSVAPDVRAVPAWSRPPVIADVPVGAYLSVPLTVDGKQLVGTICALDTEPQPAQVWSRLALVELQARLLSTVFAAALHADRASRRAEDAEAAAVSDPLTGLLNRRGWEQALRREEQRCRRYGATASVLAVDLDRLKAVNDAAGHAAGDALLQRAARVLAEAFRVTDTVARLGGDEFGVLSVETDAASAHAERERVQRLLDAAGVRASIGVGTRAGDDGLVGAWTTADGDMYRVKRAKRDRPAPG